MQFNTDPEFQCLFNALSFERVDTTLKTILTTYENKQKRSGRSKMITFKI